MIFMAFSGNSFLQVLLLAGGLIPGWLLGRALQTRAGLTGAFIGSVVVIYSLVLALDALGLQINAVSMATALVISNCGLLALPFILPRRGTVAHDTYSGSAHDAAGALNAGSTRQHYWLFFPAALSPKPPNFINSKTTLKDVWDYTHVVGPYFNVEILGL
jgi:hypothetical protein